MQKRQLLNDENKRLYDRHKRGYKGEDFLARLLQLNLKGPIQFYDYRFELNGTECQIDCLLIFERECVLIEVKHYAGDYYMKEGDMYLTSNHIKINNPFAQMDRAENYLRQLFKNENISMAVSSFVVFTHQNFYLYQDTLGIKAIYRSQLDRFIKNLQNKRCSINNNHHRIVNTLKSKRISSSSYEKKLDYKYDELDKGVTCSKCNGWLEMLGKNGRKNMICKDCTFIEATNVALLRNVKEFKILFPDREITVLSIHEWLGGEVSKNKIRDLLREYCIPENKTKNRHYLLKEEFVGGNS